MLKYQCRGCGQNIVVVEKLPDATHTCPRCGVVNNLDAPPDSAKVDEQELVTDMLERERVAQQQRQEQEAAQAVRLDAEQADKLKKHHAHRQRIERMGASAAGGGRRSGLPWILGAVAVGVLVWAGFAVLFNGANESGDSYEAFGEVDEGADIARRVDRWVRALAGRLTYRGNRVYVYHVDFDAVEREGKGLLLVKGAARLADRELTPSERQARLEPKESDADSDEPAEKAASREQLRNDLGLIREAYDPERIIDAGAPSSSGRDRKSTGLTTDAETSAAEALKKLGFKTDDSEPTAGARDGLDVARPFICVVRQDDSTGTYPDGVAMEYFVWAEQVDGGSMSVLSAAEQQPFVDVVDRVFSAFSKGNLDEVNAVHVYSGRRRSDLFPSVFQPVSWHLVRADRSNEGVVRAFVQVSDRSPALSTTWILTMLNVEADRQYRVADTWRSE